MASFDIIDASGRAYRLIWAERAYLARLAFVPLVIKIVCFGIVLAAGWQDRFLLQALVMLPSYFADGWMVSHLVRLIYLGQRWPFRPSGDAARDAEMLQTRASALYAGTLAFVVTKYLITGYTAFIYGLSLQFREHQDNPDPGIATALLIIMIVTIWAFRFIWLYIPVALEYPLKRFIGALRGYRLSFQMMGVWLVCFVPVFALFQILGGAFPAATSIAVVLAVLMDTVSSLLATAGIAFGLYELITGQKYKTQDR